VCRALTQLFQVQALSHFGSLPTGVDLIVMRQETMSAAKVADIAAKVSAAGASLSTSSLIARPHASSDSSKAHSHALSQPLHSHISSLHISEVRLKAALHTQAAYSFLSPQPQQPQHQHAVHVPPQPALHAPSPLPPPWIESFDAGSGRVYYANPQTGASTWERPQAAAHSVAPQPSPSAALHHVHPAQSHASLQMASAAHVQPMLPASAATISAFVWKWENDEGNKWMVFDAFEADLLEAAFQRNEGSVQHPRRPWLFNLKDMTQTNVDTNGRRSITRSSAA